MAHPQRRLGRPWRAGVAGVGLAVLAACGSGSDGTTVQVLWSGTTADGTAVEGVAPVTVLVADDGDEEPFSVVLGGLDREGADDAMAAAGWTGATVAMLTAGVDPRGWSVEYQTNAGIDGSSASGVLGVAVLAGIQGDTVAERAAMTGTVLPNGAIGAVQGVAAKLRAAQDAGLTLVVVPRTARADYDPVTGETVDAVRYGRSLGLQVVPVNTVTQARAVMTGGALPAAIRRSPPISGELYDIVAEGTRAAMERVASGSIAPAALPSWRQRRAGLRAQVATSEVAAARLLRREEPFVAYAQITLAESQVAEWNAANATVRSAREVGVADTADRLLINAEQQRAASAAAIEAGAATPLRTVEQYSALPDALTWGTGNLALIDAAIAELADASTRERLAAVAAELARADYRVSTYLPVQLEAVQVIGRVAEGNPPASLAILSAYADLLGQAADANMIYHELTGEQVAVAAPRARAEAQAALWRQYVGVSGTDQEDVMPRVATALSYWVASTSLVMMSDLADPGAVGRGAGQSLIVSADYFTDQIRVASTTNNTLALGLQQSDLDSSYVVWGNEWGTAWSAERAGVAIDDEERMRGLSYQWYATVQGRLLSALT